MESPVILCIDDHPTILELGKVDFGISWLLRQGRARRLCHDEDRGGNIHDRDTAGVRLQALGVIW